jgi:Ca2+-binding EF-hand superfamily protein
MSLFGTSLSGQGFITKEELRDVLRQLNQNVTEKRITEVLNAVDDNQDGKISYEEFVAMLQEM